MSAIELVSEEQVLDVVKSKGPVIPMDIRQILKAGDSIIIGATLSTLAARGIVLITHIKRGGSPFYYVKGQEEKLAELSKFLNEKDRRTFEILRERKIMKDSVEEPLTRISLRNMPDFAYRMELEINGVHETVWKWYMLSDEDAKMLLSSQKKEKKESAEHESQESLSVKEESKEEKKQDKKQEEKPHSEPKKEKKETSKKDSEFLEVKEEVQQSLISGDKQQIIAQFNDAFISKIGEFLSAGKINVKEAKQIKKGNEYDLVIEVPSPVGSIEFFCKAKGKKKCNEGDLSSAYVQGQNMRLPVLFITTGEVVKKAKEKLKSDFKGIIIKEL